MTSGEKAICCWLSQYKRVSNDCKLAENRLATDNGGVMPKLVVFWITAKAMPRWWTLKAEAIACLEVLSRSKRVNDGQFLPLFRRPSFKRTLASLKHHRKYESKNGGGRCYFTHSQQYSTLFARVIN